MNLKQVESWLELYSPKHSAGSAYQQQKLQLNRVLMANAGDIAQYGQSKADVSGDNSKDEALAADKALKDVLSKSTVKSVIRSTSDEVLDKFIKSPISGCVTVLDMARQKSGWNPMEPGEMGNWTGFSDYIKAVNEAPFFHLKTSDVKTQHSREENWDNLINNIVDLFEGVAAKDKAKITNDLKKLAHSATATSDQKQTNNLFTQSVVAVNDSVISANIYSSQVAMIVHEGKHTTKQVDFNVTRAELEFQIAQWDAVAPKVAEHYVTTVDNWLNNYTTKN